MQQRKRVIRADEVGALVSAASEWSWSETRRSVLEVLEEQYGPEALANLSPEELVEFGYAQGVGHVIMQLVAGELHPELTDPRRKKKRAPRPKQVEEN